MGILHGFLCFIGSSSAILFTSHLAARSIPFGILSIIIVMLAVLYTLCFVLFNEDKASFPTLCVLSVFRFFISTISTIDDMYFGNRKGYMRLCIFFLIILGISFVVRVIRDEKQNKE